MCPFCKQAWRRAFLKQLLQTSIAVAMTDLMPGIEFNDVKPYQEFFILFR